MNASLSISIYSFQLSSLLYPIPFYISHNSLSKQLHQKAKSGWCTNIKMNPEKKIGCQRNIPAQLSMYYDCQNSSKSLLYNDLSWISRLATCQFTSCNWIHLHTTNAKGNIHHSLSSLKEQKVCHAKFHNRRTTFDKFQNAYMFHGWK